MLRKWKFVCLFIVAAVFIAALPAAAAPALTSISPTSGYPGTQVTYTGTGFGATQGSGSVWLGNKLAGSIVSWSNTQIVAVVAATAASGSAQVQQGGTWSNSKAFTVITPNITSISPTSGYPGTNVTVNGTNFGASQGSGSVWLGNKLAGSIVSWSNTQIVAVVAATALSGSCQVQQNGVWGNSVTFTVIQPNITSISPTSGYPGTQVTFTGTNFGSSQGSGSVWLGNKLAGSIVSWSNTQVVATVAATAASGSAIVQQGGVWSNSIGFTVIQPNITSITPTSGVAGTQVTFTGTNFGASQGSGSVWLGSKLAGSIVSWSNTQVVATVDSGSVTGSAIVQQGGVWSNSLSFTVPTPVLDSVSPELAYAGDEVTLTGTNFGATQGSGSVWLGNKLAGSIVSWSNTEIVATVAAAALSGTAQVQQGGVWSNSLTFDVWNPTVYNLSPYSGPVGTQVTISGAAFGAAQGSGLVWIGTKYAAVVSWSDTEIVATVAADSATGDVQVYQGGVWSNTATFTVTPPASMQNFYVGNDFVGGYTTSYGAVTLTQIAPAGGVVVALTSSDPAVTLPATVTIPENQIQVFFDIEASEVTTPLEATISATLYGTTLEDVIQVLPPGVQYIYFDSQLQTGQPTTGTVILHKAAPSGGAVVSVVSSDSAILSVPSTITVPEGETQTTFTATTGGPVATTTNVSVTASYNGTAAVADWLYLAPPSVVSVTVTPSTIVGGEELTVEVTLSEPAAAGTIVQFQSSHYAVQPPAPLVLGAGATTGEVTFQTSYVPSTTTAVITAAIESWPGASTSVTIERLAITLDSISVSPAELVGSNPATLTVNLTAAAAAGGLEVNLYGFNAGLPPFVVVPEGETSATVPVETYVVEEVSEAYVGAHHGATGLYELITVNPPSGNSVQSLTLATPRTAGGSLVTATLTLDAPAGVGGAAIALESDNLSVATVPASVTIAEGDSTTTFDIDTDAVVEPADVMIRATYGVIRKERLTVVPTEATVSLESLSLDDSHVFRGHPVVFNGEDITGTVTLSAAAPSGGIVVTLGGSRAGIATVPASVTVPEGETSATFTITTEDADNSPYVLVTAAYDGLLRSQMMQVNPNTE